MITKPQEADLLKNEIKIVSPEEAASCVKSGDRVFIQGAAMTPERLSEAMTARADELENVELIQIHTDGKAPYASEEYKKSFRTNSLFVGPNLRKPVANGNASYVPIFLSEIHLLFRRNILPLDVAFIHVSPPDEHGFCSLGVSVDITLPAIQTAKVVIAQVNPQVPRTHGDGIIHASCIDCAIMVDEPIFSAHARPLTAEDHKIGSYIAGLVEDGATLQMGIGAIPDAVLGELGNHKRLGIHTEMFSDGLIPLVEKGIVTGEDKVVKPNKIVSAFVVGSQKVYDFVHNNPMVDMKEAAYTNDTAIIRRNPKVTAINSAIEVDLTGQVCADSVGTRQFSGVGGQMDFIRGASLSEGGKPIIALHSVTNKGISKIVPHLKEGASVTTTRAHVHYIVTEYGVANLFGKNLRERAKALIEISHPDQRELLEKAAFERFGGLL
ncbi:acetyl-CoA hydrolase/transferase family protein [Fulvivirga sp. M361]|uniref:acetyl-CoA hydrolase/transferase family protein n=1 Tax=Fulvivirga sp. M361 TaxID=2594266 RepID=UPI00117AA7FF|nr:acetyl-CoA hydrolase/transferase C-terminal domain-containing protein [Fulvivirga sp. M361]TRX59413.1 acetyl-CoA hydrolase/transferase family protein [Fulvivirga sp. M361]